MDYIIDSCEILTIELLNRIEEATKTCDRLGIGVYSDEVAQQILKHQPLRPYHERAQLISSIKGVDFVFKVTDPNNICVHKENFDLISPSTKKYNICYAPGTYDLFHQGHLEHLTENSNMCNILVAGVNEDNFVVSYKNKKPMMPVHERAAVLEKLKIVDSVFVANTFDFPVANEWIINRYGSPIDAVFLGSDWEGKGFPNPENFNLQFTYRDPKLMGTRSSTFYRKQLMKL